VFPERFVEQRLKAREDGVLGDIRARSRAEHVVFGDVQAARSFGKKFRVCGASGGVSPARYCSGSVVKNSG
jgi:hypothetical protein